jgi:hypothetical protein
MSPHLSVHGICHFQQGYISVVNMISNPSVTDHRYPRASSRLLASSDSNIGTFRRIRYTRYSVGLRYPDPCNAFERRSYSGCGIDKFTYLTMIYHVTRYHKRVMNVEAVELLTRVQATVYTCAGYPSTIGCPSMACGTGISR